VREINQNQPRFAVKGEPTINRESIHQLTLERAASEDSHAIGKFGGNWHYSPAYELEGWHWSALFHYFDKAPAKLYVQVKAKLP
jgi:hypothetical protein